MAMAELGAHALAVRIGDAEGPGARDNAGTAARPFASTGPAGHRGRMRDRLLAAGPDGLADYEILEMLLFQGIPRRDTKPLAKAVINRFGGLAPVLAAAPSELLATPGLTPDSVVALRLVDEAAARLASAEQRDRPILSNWERLSQYLAERPADPPDHLRVLFLDNRNRLLADESRPGGLDPIACCREILKYALELHATALILVRARPQHRLYDDAPEIRLASRLGQAAAILSIVLHDQVLQDADGLLSCRQQGLL